jgi:integrator complex subunit 3
MSAMGMTSQAPAAAMSVSKLVQRHSFESPTELEKELQQAHASLQPLLTPPLNVSHSMANTPQLPQALLYAMLTSPASGAATYLHHLTAVTTITGDGYSGFVGVMSRVVNDCYPKLLEQARNQVLWLLRQLISYNAADIDNLCTALLRQIAGGDLSSGNVWLASQLLDVMVSFEQWVYERPQVFTMALYTYLRLLADHLMGKSAALNELKQKEIAFCTKVLRERFQDCLMIGRDLVRLLQDVALVPEIEVVWRDLLSNPGAFKAAGFTDIGQLYVMRTPTRYLASRVTPDMETQIRFMLTSVRMGNQRRYQTWFAQRYLFTAESESLVCDLIRFICCCIHPTNQILQSDICPRWAIVGWLMKCCKSNHVEANAKLALFYDWLFFSKAENIMNIEPAILLTVHSIPKYVDMTNSLLEFLFLLVENYDPVRRELIVKGVTGSIDILVGKGVVRSLEPLSANLLVAGGLREKLNAYFPAYCKPETGDGGRQYRPEAAGMDGSLKVGGMVNYVPGGDGQASPGGGVGMEGSGVSGEEMRLGDVGESTNRKRRRAGVSESVISEVQVLFDGLTEALTKSEESASVALEKLLSYYIAASDQIQSAKLAKVENLHVAESNRESPAANNAPDMFSSSALAVERFASQIVGIVKCGGYELFGALRSSPGDSDSDEMKSLTSKLLHMYVGNNHPQMRRLLVAWHCEGLAVGPRLLCYVSRLAEEVKLPVLSRSGLTVILGECEAEDGVKSGVANMVNAVGEGIEKSSNLSQEYRSNGGDVTGNHQTNSSTVENDSKPQSKDVDSDISVDSGFKAYQEFLRQLSKGHPSGEGGELNFTANHNSTGLETQESKSGVMDDGTHKVELKCPDDVLIRHLETCLTWDMRRLARVFPSVFRHLAHMASGKEAIVSLLMSTVDPVELANYEYRVTVGEFSVVGRDVESIARLIKCSLSWDSIEQQFFWRLMCAEVLAVSPTPALQVVESSLAVVNPDVHGNAVSGLISVLRTQAPGAALLSAVLSRSAKFGRFVAVVMTGWMSTHYSVLLSSLQQLCEEGRFRSEGDEENNGKVGAKRLEKVSFATVAELLDAFEVSKDGRIGADEKIARRAEEIRRALLKVVGSDGVQGADILMENVDENS